MKPDVDRVLEDALRLSAADRSVLAAALIDSLESADSAAISAVWRAELLARRDALRSGRVTQSPWGDARAPLAAL